MSFPMYGFKDACSTGLKLFGEKCKDSDWPLFIKTTMPPINTSGESWLYPEDILEGFVMFQHLVNIPVITELHRI